MASIKTKDIKTDIDVTEHDFGEKAEEFSARDGKKLPVVQLPKYKETKARVIEMLDSGKYKGLNDSHFWILMNRTKSEKMAYSGLIISHDGMKIINDNLPPENKVKAACFSMPIQSEYKKDCMFMYYQDEDTLEFGEISTENCDNKYPYAMLFKRCYDRVVKDKAKMYGVYSEAEADEFVQRLADPEPEKQAKPKAKAVPPTPATTPAPAKQPSLDEAARLNSEGIDVYKETERLYNFEERSKILKHYGKDFWYEMPIDIINQYYEGRKNR